MTQFTLVPALRLEAACGSTMYPDENGFSATWGEAESDTPALDEVLDRMVSAASVATLRCGVLEVTGIVQHPVSSEKPRVYKIAVESVRYRAQ